MKKTTQHNVDCFLLQLEVEGRSLFPDIQIYSLHKVSSFEMEFNDERTWNMGKFSHFKSSKGRKAARFCYVSQKLSNNLYALWTGNVLDEYFVPIFKLTSISGSQAVNILLRGT